MNDSTDKKINQKNEVSSCNPELEALRMQWRTKQRDLLTQAKFAYPATANLTELITLHPDENAGQIENNNLLALQHEAKTLFVERDCLWAEDMVVAEFNKRHAAVHTDQFHILTEKEHPVFGGIDFTLESKQSFKSYYEPELVTCWDGKQRPKAEVWLKSPKRRSYKGIIFDPAKPGEINGYYNLWKGFKKEPIKGDASKYWDHVRENICSNDENAYRFVRKWLAFIFQHPDKVHTALVLCGSQGVGKNSFVEPLGILLGTHYVLLSSLAELVSNFNFHLKNAVIIHANEALWGGDKRDIGTIKAMITEQTCLIEGKGKDRIMVRNFKHFLFSSNEEWPVHLDRDDRRFFVLRVSEAHKEDDEYFAAIQQELNQGGYEALLYDLLNEDFIGFNPRKFPHSIEAFSIKMLGQDSSARYIFSALQEGHFQVGADENGCWQPGIPKDCVYQDYVKWCLNNGEKPLKNHLFGKTLIKLIPSIKCWRMGNGESRSTAYKLPNLEQARDEFRTAFKGPSDIFDVSVNGDESHGDDSVTVQQKIM